MKTKKMKRSGLMYMLAFLLAWNACWPLPVSKADSDTSNGIRLSMTSDVPTVPSGKVFTYEVKFSFSDLNPGGMNIDDMRLILPIPAGVEFVDYTPIPVISGFTKTGNDAIFTFNKSKVEAGTSYTLQVNVKFSPYVTLNGATATTAPKILDADDTLIEPADDVTVTATAKALWKLTKSKVSPKPTPMAGGNVQYEIFFNNDQSASDIGVLDIENVMLTDTLPPDSVFVSASDGGVAGPGNTVIWPPIATMRHDKRFYVTVNYPSPTFDHTSTVMNKADIVFSPLGEGTVPLTASVSHRFQNVPEDQGLGGIFRKDTFERHQEISPGQDVKFFIGGFHNYSNDVLTDASIVDLTPTKDTSNLDVDLQLKSIKTAIFQDIPTVTYSVYYATNPAGNDWTLWKDVSSVVSEELIVADLPGPPAKISGVKFEFPGSLPISFEQRSNFELVYTLRSATPLNIDTQKVINTADLYYKFQGTPKQFHDPSDFFIWESRPLVRLEKDIVGPSSYSPEQEVEFEITVSNSEYSSDQFHDPVVMDVLPTSALEYDASVGDIMPIYDKSGFALTGSLKLVSKKPLDADRTLLRWEFDNPVTMNVNDYFTIRYKAKVKKFAEPTTYVNKAELTTNWSAKPYFNDYYFDPIIDAEDHDEDLSISDQLIANDAQFTVNTVAELGSFKRVRGELDEDWKPIDELGTTVAGGRIDYKLTVYNRGNVPLDKIALVDVLPRIGDEGALLGTRGTEWNTVLTKAVPNDANATTGYTVWYSTDDHPKMGAGTAWSATPPEDLTTVTGLKFEFVPSYQLAPDAKREITWSMMAPVGAPTTKVAWNSFGQQASKVGGSALEPAEPPKVGVRILPDLALSIGDYVWVDLNENGIQDEDLTKWGVNGVVVELLNGDGTPFTKEFKDDGNTVQVPVTTVTGDDKDGRPGFYQFPNLTGGGKTYKVRFALPQTLPDKYKYGSYANSANKFTTWTLKGADPADLLDSNVGGTAVTPNTSATVETGIITLNSVNDMSIDAGLLPPRGSIGNYVWEDTDGDGIQDATESGINGVTVELFEETAPGTWTSRGTKTTATSGGKAGFYEFTGLLPGNYKVKFPETFVIGGVEHIMTFKTSGTDRQTDSNPNANGMTDVINLQLGEINDTIDAGYVEPVEIGNFIWNDTNANGVQDGGEPGYDGLTVRLFDGSNNPVKQTDGTTNRTVVTAGGGNYLFDKLLPGTYKVEFALPAGFGFTKKNIGADDTIDSDVNRSANNAPTVQTSGRTDNYDLSHPGDSDMTVDAGVVKLVSLGDYVWMDKDKDGVQDAGENGVSGVNVHLYYDDDSTTAVYRTTTTPASGAYSFDNLYPGKYTVEFERPDGYKFTIKNGGADPTKDSDANMPAVITDTKAKSDQITLLNVDNMDLDAGLVELASVGDFVWMDANHNGVQDAGELGVSGVTVQLLDNAGNPVAADAYGNPIATKTTAADGKYEFKNLEPSKSYQVKFSLPGGYWFTTPNSGGNDAVDSDAVTAGDDKIGFTPITPLDVGDHNLTLDAGVMALASLGDLVWEDKNGNGVQDAGEPGVVGATVQLLDNAGNPVATNAYGVAITNATTDNNGKYAFTNLLPGDYKVKFYLPAGYDKFTGIDKGSDDAKDSDANDATGITATVTLAWSEQNIKVDAGVVKYASLGDFVWDDKDGDGIQDAGEPAYAGIEVVLLDKDLNPLQTKTTDPSGNYSFTGLWPNNYVVMFKLPDDNHMFSPQKAGTNRTIDSNVFDTGYSEVVTLASGENNVTVDAGIVELVSIGDYVWEDLNDNGIQDAGDHKFPGVTVQLLNTTNVVLATTTTGADGKYLFDKRAPGSYKVKFIAPAGYGFARQDQGANDAEDSDANRTTGITGTYTLSPGQDVDTVDAGLVKLVNLGDTVWNDKNGNGVQDSGEAGVDGVTVTLFHDETGNTSQAGTTTTASGGNYKFANLLPGTYKVQFTRPNGYLFTGKGLGGNAAKDSDVIVPASNVATSATGSIVLRNSDNLDIDAGLIELASIGDYVWLDQDDDGIQDAGEPAVSGVKVELLDDSGNPAMDAYGNTVASQTTVGTGKYKFINLEPNKSYQVKFTLPNGYWFAKSNQGADDDIDSDAVPQAGGKIGLTPIVLAGYGKYDDSLDAGVLALASLGDFVWDDKNGNGIQDGGEPGVDGVKAELLDNSGNPIATDAYGAAISPVTTAGGGKYSFSNLKAGSYKVKFSHLPAGYKFTLEGNGSAATGSDADPSDGVTGTVSLQWGQNDTTTDAGIVKPASLGDFVWEDQNGDGKQDAGEPGIENIAVTLYDAGDLNTVTKATYTDAAGKYSFTDLWPGSYVVKFGLASDLFTYSPKYAPTTTNANDSDAGVNGWTTPVTLASGDSNNTVDAGIVELVSIGDYVWEDLNDDGLQDAGDQRFAGVTVQLLDTSDTVLATTTTDANGKYLFDKLAPGSYKIKFTAVFGYGFARKDQGSDTADSDADRTTGITGIYTLTPGQHISTVDAGLVKLVDLGDLVWNDKDGDGIQDAGEAGIDGVTVKLYHDEAGDTSLVGTTTTAGGGLYQFTNLLPGLYKVQFVRPAGYLFTKPHQGGDGSKDSDAKTPASIADTDTWTNQIHLLGSNNMNIDAGLIELAAVGDFVWLDQNDNGIQDAGEPGVSGVTVQLLDGAGNPVATDALNNAIAPIVTDGTGSYAFDNLTPGAYQVKFTLPDGYWFAKPNEGADDEADSDALPQAGTGKVSIVSVALAGRDNNTSIDAGVLALSSLGDFVWVDSNGNGIQDAGEPAVTGVKVELLDNSGNPITTNAYGAAISPAVTNGTGKYSFNNLKAGSYKVKFSNLPAGFVFTQQGQGTVATGSDADPSDGVTGTITLPWGQNNIDVDAGILKLASLGDLAWKDLNGDGVQDGGEPGMSAITVNLFKSGDLVTPVKTTTTDADGNYAFTGLWPGSYVIKFELPSGKYVFSPKDAPAASDATDSDADSAGWTASVSLASGDNDDSIDAGIIELASIGDTIWDDSNDNGIQDSGENGYPNVKVHLLHDDETPVLDALNNPITDTTDADGKYLFEKLVPGDYKVKFELPTGYMFAKKKAASGTDITDSDVNPSTGITDKVTLKPFMHNMNVDAGIVKLATLGDRVWMDRNLNGIQDAGEVGVIGVNVHLLDENGAAVMKGGVAVTASTDASGNYQFTNLVPGKYKVKFDLPAGYVFTQKGAGSDRALDSDAEPTGASIGETSVVTLSPGEVNLNVDAGIIKLVNLGDKLWVDTGIIGQQDGEASDPAASGVTVHLLHENGAAVMNGGVAVTDTTDANGSYAFTNLLPGKYRVKFDLPTGYLFTRQLLPGTGFTSANDSNVDADGVSDVITLIAGSDDMTVDGGIVLPASLGNFLWIDANGNGKQDPGEKGQNGLKVELYDHNNLLVSTTMTADDGGKPGYYSFTNLVPGDYKVKFTPPAGYMFTLKRAGADVTIDSDADNGGSTEWITLRAGENNLDVDAGVQLIPAMPLASIGDRVWIDVNANGVQDDNEVGLNGVTVELYNSFGAIVGIAATTNGKDGKPGYYLFTNLLPGEYAVKFVSPDGYMFSPTGAGTDIRKDSNAKDDGTTGKISLVAGLDETVDAGLVPLASLGDYVWIDEDGNGKQDASEKGQNGIGVTLYDESGRIVATTITDNGPGGRPGHYLFTNLKPGTYTVKFDLPVGYEFSKPHASGTNGSNDSDADENGITGKVTLAPGSVNSTIDAGLHPVEKEPSAPEEEENGEEGNGGGKNNGGTNAGGKDGNPTKGNGTKGNGKGSGNVSGGKGNTKYNAPGEGEGDLPKTGEQMPVMPYIGFGLAAVAASLLIRRRFLRNK